MNPHDIYMENESLMTPAEKAIFRLKPNSCAIPDIPRSYLALLRSDLPTPDAMDRVKFESRAPALGLTASALDEIEAHEKNPKFTAPQRGRLYISLRNSMLRALIPCSGASDIPGLVSVLRKELVSMSPVPEWYLYSTVTMGPRKLGYDYCSTRGCTATEDLAVHFSLCGRCKVCVYCSRECQLKDWNERHKAVCKKAAAQREQMNSVGKMMQRLSDVSLSGKDDDGKNGNDIGSILRGMPLPPAVEKRSKQFREGLEKESERDRPNETTHGW